MTELNIGRGLKSYTMKGEGGQCEIRFNPTDEGFLERMYATIEQLEAITDKKRKEWESLDDPKGIFDLMRQLDRDVRAEIDGLFGGPVSQAVCGDVRICAYSDGLPIWMNMILAVIDEMDASLRASHDMGRQRLNKYTAKYAKTPRHRPGKGRRR